jgi:hypothetical protein
MAECRKTILSECFIEASITSRINWLHETYLVVKQGLPKMQLSFQFLQWKSPHKEWRLWQAACLPDRGREGRKLFSMDSEKQINHKGFISSTKTEAISSFEGCVPGFFRGDSHTLSTTKSIINPDLIGWETPDYFQRN